MIKPWSVHEIRLQPNGEKWVDYSVKKIIDAECCKKLTQQMRTVVVIPAETDIDEYLYQALKAERWIE